MTNKCLYDWFAASSYFEINEYALKYLDILANSTTIDNVLNYHKHHCIPVCYYKYTWKCKTRKIAEKIANTDPNNIIIAVSFGTHILLHFYLCNFCIDTKLKKRLISAFLQLMNFSHSWKDFIQMDDREIFQEASKHYKKLIKDYYGKAVICIELNKKFDSICQANEFIGKDRYSYCGISNTCNCRDGQQTAGGYHWCFAEDNIKYQELVNKYYLKAKKIYNKPVYCFELDKTFESAAEAARTLANILGIQINRSLITSCCTKTLHATNNYHFCYEKDKAIYKLLPYNDKTRTEIAKQHIGEGTKKAMRLIPKEIRKKQIEKAKQYWILPKHYYNNDIEEIRAEICPDGWKPGRLAKYKTKGKQIKCIELNKVFGSCVEAGNELHIDSNSINNCIHKRSKTAGGYHWSAIKNL